MPPPNRRALAIAAGLALAPALFGLAARAEPAPRSPLERQRLIDLAYDLGQAHALHRLCAGPQDDLWRGRMGELLRLERPDPDLHRRLADSFNAGFQAAGLVDRTCSAASQARLRALSAKAAPLARQLGELNHKG